MVDIVSQTNPADLCFNARLVDVKHRVAASGVNDLDFVGVLALHQAELQSAQLNDISRLDLVALS